MIRRTIYFRENDAPIAEAARRIAGSRKISFSELVTEALADYLPRIAAEPTPAERWAAIAPDTNAA